MKINKIRFFRTKVRLAKKEYRKEEEEFNRLRFFIEKDMEGYPDEVIEDMRNDRNLRFIEDTGTSLN